METSRVRGLVVYNHLILLFFSARLTIKPLFLMVNLLKADHGEKMKAFSEICSVMNHLEGELDYTHGKIHFFNSSREDAITSSYAFLTQ